MEKTHFLHRASARALGERKTPGRGPRKVDMTLWGKGAAAEWTSFPVNTGKRGIWSLWRRGVYSWARGSFSLLPACFAKDLKPPADETLRSAAPSPDRLIASPALVFLELPTILNSANESLMTKGLL